MLSQNLGVPLAPSATLFWTSLDIVQEVESLQKWLVSSDVKVEAGIVAEISGPVIEDVVKSLRKIFIPHKIINDKVVLSGENAAAFRFHSWLWDSPTQ